MKLYSTQNLAIFGPVPELRRGVRGRSTTKILNTTTTPQEPHKHNTHNTYWPKTDWPKSVITVWSVVLTDPPFFCIVTSSFPSCPSGPQLLFLLLAPPEPFSLCLLLLSLFLSLALLALSSPRHHAPPALSSAPLAPPAHSSLVPHAPLVLSFLSILSFRLLSALNRVVSRSSASLTQSFALFFSLSLVLSLLPPVFVILTVSPSHSSGLSRFWTDVAWGCEPPAPMLGATRSRSLFCIISTSHLLCGSLHLPHSLSLLCSLDLHLSLSARPALPLLAVPPLPSSSCFPFPPLPFPLPFLVSSARHLSSPPVDEASTSSASPYLCRSTHYLLFICALRPCLLCFFFLAETHLLSFLVFLLCSVLPLFFLPPLLLLCVFSSSPNRPSHSPFHLLRSLLVKP